MNQLNFSYYLITDRKACAPQKLADVVEEACRFGIKAIQLREKDLTGRALLKLSRQLRKITARYGVLLFINDRVDVAMTVGADGVHCRETSFSAQVIRHLKDDLIIGASVHSVKRAKKASEEGADFLIYGPVFRTSSKPDHQPQGLKNLQEVADAVSAPVFALGGITPERATKCLEAGAAGVAGISSIMKSSSVKDTVSQWKRELGGL